MLKIIGAILICGGSAAMGLSASARLSLRIRVMNAFANVLDLIHSEIVFLLTPLSDLLGKCARSTPEPVNRFFEDCLAAYQEKADLPFALAWSKTVKEAAYLELTGQERQILLELGNALGRYDAEEQGQIIEHARRAMEGRMQAAERERARLGKLYGSLGIACGIAMVIVFI